MGAVDLARVAALAASLFGTPDPATVAGTLATVRPAQREAARAWNGERPVPDDLAAFALTEQRLVFALADSQRLRARVLPRLPAAERAGVRDEVRAQVDLQRLAAGWPVKPVRDYETGTAESATALWGYYGRARRRFGDRRATLAAVNLSSRPSTACAATASPAPRDRCSSSPRPGRRTGSAATSATRATRSWAPPTTCTPTARRATPPARSCTTTRAACTSMPCGASPATCAQRQASAPSTGARCSCAARTGRTAASQVRERAGHGPGPAALPGPLHGRAGRLARRPARPAAAAHGLLAAALDALRPARGAPIAVVHLGSGALALPRYVAARSTPTCSRIARADVAVGDAFDGTEVPARL